MTKKIRYVTDVLHKVVRFRGELNQ